MTSPCWSVPSSFDSYFRFILEKDNSGRLLRRFEVTDIKEIIETYMKERVRVRTVPNQLVGQILRTWFRR